MSALLMGLVWGIELPAHEQSVMLALADHGRDDGTKIFPSIELLCWKLDKQPRQIQYVLRALERKNLIIPVAYATGGRGHPTEYEMHLENGTPKKPLARANRVQSDAPIDEDKGCSPASNTQNAPIDAQRVQSSVIKGAVQRKRVQSSVIKGAVASAPEPYNHHIEPSEEPYAHAREKKKRAEAEADPEPPPGSAAPPLPPPFNVFAAEYRRTH